MTNIAGRRLRPGADIDLVFSKALLLAGLDEVRKCEPQTDLKAARVYRLRRQGRWLFNGPGDFYWYGPADDEFDARYQGWMAWLDSRGWQVAVHET